MIEFVHFCPRRCRLGPVRTTSFSSMLSTLLVIAGVLVGLLVLLTLIVHLSARPATRPTTAGTRAPDRVVGTGQPHPDAWAPLSTTSTQVPAVR